MGKRKAFVAGIGANVGREGEHGCDDQPKLCLRIRRQSLAQGGVSERLGSLSATRRMQPNGRLCHKCLPRRMVSRGKIEGALTEIGTGAWVSHVESFCGHREGGD